MTGFAFRSSSPSSSSFGSPPPPPHPLCGSEEVEPKYDDDPKKGEPVRERCGATSPIESAKVENGSSGTLA